MRGLVRLVLDLRQLERLLVRHLPKVEVVEPRALGAVVRHLGVLLRAQALVERAELRGEVLGLELLLLARVRLPLKLLLPRDVRRDQVSARLGVPRLLRRELAGLQLGDLPIQDGVVALLHAREPLGLRVDHALADRLLGRESLLLARLPAKQHRLLGRRVAARRRRPFERWARARAGGAQGEAR